MKIPRLALLGALFFACSSACAEPTRPELGATPHADGATFRVWAPHAAAMAVGGEFNDWHAAPMAREDPAEVRANEQVVTAYLGSSA